MLHLPRPDSQMIRRCFAWWLVLLITTPFTAPFASCDLTTVFGQRARAVRAINEAAALVGAATRETRTVIAAPEEAAGISPLLIEESSKDCEITLRCSRVSRLDRPADRSPRDRDRASSTAAARTTVLRL
jgi:hypothetical protein